MSGYVNCHSSRFQHCRFQQSDLFANDFQALKAWKGEALEVFTVPKVLSLVTNQLAEFSGMLPGMEPPMPRGCKKDNDLYNAAAMLTPPEKLMLLHDSELAKLLKKYSSNVKEHALKFRKHAQDHWGFNTTLVDMDWYHALVEKRVYDLGHDPFQAREDFAGSTLPSRPQKPSRLFDYFSPFSRTWPML